MRIVPARELLAQGKIVLSGWSVVPGGFLAEAMASGIHTASPAFAGRMAEMAVRFITLAGDFNFILAGQGVFHRARETLAAFQPTPN